MTSDTAETLLTTSLLMLVLLLTAAKAVHLFPLQRTHSIAWQSIPFASGDLLLCSLAGIKDDVLKFCFHCPITHVGMVVRDARGATFIWEATRRGCRLVPLRSYCTSPRSIFVYRKLLGPPLDPTRLERALTEHVGRKYSHCYWRPVYNQWFPYLPLATPAHRQTRFCTDLIADTLARVGVLDFSSLSRTCADLLPADFTEAAESLPFTTKYRYGTEVRIIASAPAAASTPPAR